MKLLVTADNLLTATLWQNVLASAGIACELRNRFLGGAVGDLPADQVRPQLWLADARDETAARTLLEEMQHPPVLPAWSCARCGEAIEGQFFQCWCCQASRPA